MLSDYYRDYWREVQRDAYPTTRQDWLDLGIDPDQDQPTTNDHPPEEGVVDCSTDEDDCPF